MSFYSHVVQSCDEGVKVMAELDDEGKVIGIQSVTLPEGSTGLACQIDLDELSVSLISAEGSCVNCIPPRFCPHRRVEG